MSGRSILCVDDEVHILNALKRVLCGYSVRVATNAAQALACLEDAPVQLIICDQRMPGMNGTTLLAQVKQRHPGVKRVLLSGHTDANVMLDAINKGSVLRYLTKPWDNDELRATIAQCLSESVKWPRTSAPGRRPPHSSPRTGTGGFHELLTESSAMREAIQLLARAAESDVTILLEGESGTGKEIAARAVHAESARRGGPFVAVNCGAIPESLVESELFGHEKGAFTGACSARPGLFERAEAGTILLDEIGELRVDTQVKLLRVLQERSVTRVGGTAPRDLDVRIIAATHHDLQDQVARGAFRRDLYYRLAVFPVRLPALRTRAGDVLLLAEVFLRRFTDLHGRPISGLSSAARGALERYDWPGNVRQLENVLERAVLLEDGPEIQIESLIAEVAESRSVRLASPVNASAHQAIVPLHQLEARAILSALNQTQWNVKETARRLGIGRTTIYRKIGRYGLQDTEAVPGPESAELSL